MEPILSGVGVIDKALAIISAVETEPLSLSELTEATGLSRATAHRLAAALEAHAMLRRVDNGRYALGFRFLALGHRVSERFPLLEMVPPVLARLRDLTGESTQLYVRDAGERVCVAAVESEHGLRTIVGVGERLTMEVGSAARALVGDLLSEGYAESVAEREQGVASVSVPVADGSGAIVAAVSVSGPVGRMGASPGNTHGPALLAAAKEIRLEQGWL